MSSIVPTGKISMDVPHKKTSSDFRISSRVRFFIIVLYFSMFFENSKTNCRVILSRISAEMEVYKGSYLLNTMQEPEDSDTFPLLFKNKGKSAFLLLASKKAYLLFI